ncbi:hypothetical protein JHK82_045093 [Glycine max]|nr:hypothetical protein JHK82_045093 [Glycine max]
MKSTRAHRGGDDDPRAGNGSAAAEVAVDARCRSSPGRSHTADAAADAVEGTHHIPEAAAAEGTLHEAAPMGNPVGVEGKEIRALFRIQLNKLIRQSH